MTRVTFSRLVVVAALVDAADRAGRGRRARRHCGVGRGGSGGSIWCWPPALTLALGCVQALAFVETGYGKLHVAYVILVVGLPALALVALVAGSGRAPAR